MFLSLEEFDEASLRLMSLVNLVYGSITHLIGLAAVAAAGGEAASAPARGECPSCQVPGLREYKEDDPEGAVKSRGDAHDREGVVLLEFGLGLGLGSGSGSGSGSGLG